MPMDENVKSVSLAHCKEKWKSEIVARKEISTCTGGLLGSRHMANLDSQGKGIKRRFRFKNQVFYYVADVFEFIEKQSTLLQNKK